MSNDEILDLLMRSALFAPDFPRAKRRTHEDAVRLTQADKQDDYATAVRASGAIRDRDAIIEWVRALGKAKYQPAVPTLVELWATCAVGLVRIAVGHALREIGTPEARRALTASLEEDDHFACFIAVRAIFDADPQGAFARFSPRFTPAALRRRGGTSIAQEILSTFAPSGSSGDGRGNTILYWSDPRAPEWLKAEPGWLALAARFRKDKQLGATARDVLAQFDATVVAAAVDQVDKEHPTPIVKVSSTATGDLLSRYKRGDFEAVWREMRQHEAIDGELRDEVLAVAMETMRRVAISADLVAQRLEKRGWKVPSGALRMRPRWSDRFIFRRLVKATGGPLPPSLQAFWSAVGGIDFIWNSELDQRPPDLGVALNLAEMDPLAIASPAMAREELREWEEDCAGIAPELVAPFMCALAPDDLHKANISGGLPYEVELPFKGADPILANEPHELPLVDYLRLSFRWAGFPFLERHSDREDVRSFVRDMTRGVEPF